MADEEGNQPPTSGEEEPQPPAESEDVVNTTDANDGDDNKPPSNVGSQRGSAQGSRAGSRAGSQTGGDDNKPPSATGSRQGSAKGSRAGSQAGSQAGSRAASQAGSQAGGDENKPPSKPASRQGSAQGSRAASRAGSEAGGDTNDNKPPSRQGSRSASRTSAYVGPHESKPGLPEASSRHGSLTSPGLVTDGKAMSVSGIRPASARSDTESEKPEEKKGSNMSAGEREFWEFEEFRSLELRRKHSSFADGVHSDADIFGSDTGVEMGAREDRTFSESFLEDSDSLRDEAADMRFPTFEEATGGPMAVTRWTTGGGGAPDGDDGDDYGGGDNDDDEEEMDDDEEGLESEDSENETDMVVLDPDHPLMKRFQAALNAHLTKQNEKISLELRDLDESLRVKKKEREDLGVDLYGVQQELARYQMLLEQKHDQVANLKQERQREEQELFDVRQLYKDSQLITDKEKKKGAELQGEVENLALRLFYMENAKEDVRSDIAVMRRAAEKVESEVAKSETEKQRQDLYVDRLVEKVDKLKEEIAMYEAQISAQSEETKAARDSLMEAHMEIETISLEKKDLYQKWTSSLIGMRRRDEAHAATAAALDQQEQHILSLATEIEGYKKSIQKEQEQNEKLTMILNKTEKEIDLARKHMGQVQAKHDALKAEYTTYTRMLHETEQALSRASSDRALRQAEVSSLMKQIEGEFQMKLKLEDDIMERLRAQLTLDKAAQYSKKLSKNTRSKTKSLEMEAAEVENIIASNSLDTVNVKTRVGRLKKILAELDLQIAEQNNIISKSEMEIVKRNAIIERKQNQVDLMNKKLNQMIASAGGVELGPLEIQLNSLNKSIESCNQNVADLQQQWLRQQSELVRLSQTKEKEMEELVACKRQLTILSQKKIRTENDIDHQHREMCDIEKNIRNMRNDIIKLNILLHKEKYMGEELEQGNALLENAFISGLKDAELESIELQGKLDGIKEEKERLLNSLVEAERQIMLWEKKTQLARETRAAVDSEVGQGEIRAMKSEIHRMQVRYSQLMKQQEKMIQDMEKAVSRRDTIVTRGDAQAKMKKKVLTKGTFERQMGELRKKIKQTIQDANACDNEMKELREHQQGLSEQLEEKQINCQQLQGAADTLDGDLERTLEIKQKNLTELLARQQKMKYYQQVKDGKYTMMCRTPSALHAESQKQEDRLQALTTIVDRLNEEFPRAQPALRKVTMALGSRRAPMADEA